jgi:integrase
LRDSDDRDEDGKPYWQPLTGGVSLGYRRTEGVGSWNVRLANGKGGNAIRRIASADDERKADGKQVMTFAQAREAALRWGKGEEDVASAAVWTVDDVIVAYEADLEARGGLRGNVSRLRHNLPATLLKRPVALLTADELRNWRNDMRKRLAPSGVNRLMTCLRAALNLALTKEERLSSRVWEIGLAAFPDATMAHNVILSDDTVIRLVYAAYDYDSSFGLVVEALAITGARISQISRCQVRDLVDGDRLMVPSSAKGKKKRATRVPVPIPVTLSERLLMASGGKGHDEPLLPGTNWRDGRHTRMFAQVVETIGEDSRTITSYALRHTHITHQLLANIPVQLVAKLHDTSVSQIELHYAATITSNTDDMVRAAMQTFDRGNVVPIR